MREAILRVACRIGWHRFVWLPLPASDPTVERTSERACTRCGKPS